MNDNEKHPADKKDNYKKNQHPLYKIWVDIKRRCCNNNRHDFKWYGAKGIILSNDWNPEIAVIKSSRKKKHDK